MSKMSKTFDTKIAYFGQSKSQFSEPKPKPKMYQTFWTFFLAKGGIILQKYTKVQNSYWNAQPKYLPIKLLIAIRTTDVGTATLSLTLLVGKMKL